MTSRITHWHTEYNRRYTKKLRVDVYGLAYTVFINWKKREENPSSFHLYSPQRKHKCHTQPEIWQGQG
jgi:hypothetical protein